MKCLGCELRRDPRAKRLGCEFELGEKGFRMLSFLELDSDDRASMQGVALAEILSQWKACRRRCRGLWRAARGSSSTTTARPGAFEISTSVSDGAEPLV